MIKYDFVDQLWFNWPSGSGSKNGQIVEKRKFKNDVQIAPSAILREILNF